MDWQEIAMGEAKSIDRNAKQNMKTCELMSKELSLVCKALFE